MAGSFEHRIDVPSRRGPPDYTRRGVKLRIFLWLAAIMAVLSVWERSREQPIWKWRWGRALDAAPKVDNRLREPLHRTAGDPAGTFISEKQAESTDMAMARAQVRDDTPVFRPAERDIWFHDLARVRDKSSEDLKKESLGEVAYLLLHKQPPEYRGKVVTLRGTVRRAYRSPATENDLGVKEYCVYVLQPVGQPDAIVYVYAWRAPEGFPRLGADGADSAGLMREDVEVTGIFFKRCAYAAKGGTFTAPVLLTGVPKWQRQTPAATRDVAVAEVIGAVVAALLLAACLAAVLWKRTGRSHPDRREDQSGAFVDLGRLKLGPSAKESIRELEAQARGEGRPG